MPILSLALLAIALLVTGCTTAPSSPASPTPRPTLVTLAPPSPPEMGSAPTTIVDVPVSIDATGQRNVAKALQAFVDEVPDGTQVAFADGGRYRLGTGLRIDDRHDLVFDGNGSTFISEGCDPEASFFTIGEDSASSGIVIRDMVMLGGNERAGSPEAFSDTCQWAMGVSVQGSSDVEIADVAISRIYGDCVYVGNGGRGRGWSDNVYFHDSTCELIGRQGVAITAGSRVHVARVTFDEIGIMAFDIEPNEETDGARDVVFTNNTVGTTGVSSRFEPMLFGANGNLDAEVRNVTISNNVVTGGTLRTLVGDEDKGWSGGRNHHDITFVGNRSDAVTEGPVLHFRHVDGLTIYGNEQPLSNGDLVKIVDSVNVVSR